jgi:UDP-GlcNAc:undecaprenyl-phosphate/decaprenyl-phosphate GlcNAc-1-phosphate transferase
MSPTHLHTFIAFGIGAAAAAAATPAVRHLAMKTGCYAVPLHDRWHRTRPIPLLGGFAIIVGFLAALVMVDEWRPLIPLAICSGLMATLGAVDDFWTVRASMKLVVQMLIAGLLLVLVSPPPMTGSVIVDQLLAFIWIVGITNAFNLLDNMDGLSAGVATIAGGGYLALLLWGHGSALTVPVAAFVGATAAFLIYNFPPASIFMGDSGSFFLGSFLAGVGLMIGPSLERPAHAAFVPMLILLVPIFDTAFVTYTRKRAGRSAMVGGRDHTSHRLVALGVSERAAVLTLYGLAGAGALLAFGVGHLPLGMMLAIVGLYAMLVLAIGVVLASTAEAPASGEPAAAPPPLISEVANQRRVYEILADTGLLAIAYYAAFRLRFQGPDFDTFFPPFVRTLPIVMGMQVAGLYFAGKYRQVWRSVSAAELGTLIRGLALGVTGAVLFILIVFRFERFSRGVFIIDALVAWFLLVGTRALTTGIDDYLRRVRVRGARVLVYGAGRGGTLLVRELLQNRDAGFIPVGFIDEDPQKWRLHIEGIPVLGGGDDLAALVARHAIKEILVSVRDISASRLADLLAECNTLGVRLSRMRFSIDEVRPPIVLRHDQHNSRGA